MVELTPRPDRLPRIWAAASLWLADCGRGEPMHKTYKKYKGRTLVIQPELCRACGRLDALHGLQHPEGYKTATVASLMGPMELREGRGCALAFMLRIHGGADATA